VSYLPASMLLGENSFFILLFLTSSITVGYKSIIIDLAVYAPFEHSLNKVYEFPYALLASSLFFPFNYIPCSIQNSSHNGSAT
jgi:hypothetical protein